MKDEKKEKIGSVVLWCLRQKKGIKIRLPNDNLASAYVKKANDSLKAMSISYGADLRDWAIDAAYYARYHSIYALLQKCGIESEIHDCSITLLKFLFGERFSKEKIEELEEAKKQRINLVYYTNRLVSEEEIKKNIALAPEFVLCVEKILSEVSKEEIESAREKIRKIT